MHIQNWWFYSKWHAHKALNKSLGLFCSSATTSYTSLPFICDQTKPLFILWSSPETHPNIASLYLPPSVCLAGSLTQSFNYSTKLHWASPKYHTLHSVLKVKRSSAGAALSHPASCFHLLTQERDSVNCFNSLQIILWSTNLLYSNDSILRTLNQVKNKKTAHVFICCWFSFLKISNNAKGANLGSSRPAHNPCQWQLRWCWIWVTVFILKGTLANSL